MKSSTKARSRDLPERAKQPYVTVPSIIGSTTGKTAAKQHNSPPPHISYNHQIQRRFPFQSSHLHKTARVRNVPLHTVAPENQD
jgi:hypothetical protein